MESYPPLFRNQIQSRSCDLKPTIIIKQEEISRRVDDAIIPTIDLQSVEELACRSELEDACKNWGIFRLVNHGVPPQLLTQLNEQAKKLFSLPFDYKQNTLSSTSPVSYFWGTPALTPSGSAIGQNLHWLEGLNVPLAQLSHSSSTSQLPLLLSFRNLLDEYGAHMGRISGVIFEKIARKLGLDEAQRESYLSVSTGFIRMYRYPPYTPPQVEEEEEMESSIWGLGAHTDSSVLTILSQDQVGGLEVLKDQQWIPINPVPDTLIVNIGDMMQAMSSDELKSAIHRVRLSKEHERLSMGYFVFPAKDGIIQSAKYRPFTYTDFQASVQQDIKILGHKVWPDIPHTWLDIPTRQHFRSKNSFV